MCVYVRGFLRENIFLSLIQLIRGIIVKADQHLLINKKMGGKATNLSEVIMVNFNRLSHVSFSFLAKKKKQDRKKIINGNLTVKEAKHLLSCCVQNVPKEVRSLAFLLLINLNLKNILTVIICQMSLSSIMLSASVSALGSK